MNDWVRLFVESPLTGIYDINNGESLLFRRKKTLQQKIDASECDVKYNRILNGIKIQEKYPTRCPNCGAPHDPNERKCEYCGSYMKEE